MHAGAPWLETERLWLRQFVPEDLEAYAAMTADPTVMEHIDGGVLTRADAARSFEYHLDHWARQGFGFFAVEEKASRELVGRIGLIKPYGWHGLELGWLLKRSCWGRGLATEGGRVALDDGFQRLEGDQILSTIEPQNQASIRVAQKLGESFDRSIRLNGKDVSVYTIERQTWEHTRRAAE